ncbi:NAD(P)/FAD-dependent oxidoreductase [Paracandidimonas soli]|uniref:Glycine/D-amino acid oxidase-like deaminating enzyme n=1 Tax=Paracandidimonas soli TaxID=1917182 RepID=A0A4R3VCR5_9BURK|nr:FAD-binding oxidoreductase [Paracandidimonas soli]TCV03116.1 glycine/D-amino acid oxidase-like deaminating enzyme [Paracandidimonas soli]
MADVIIIGGGAIGASIALFCKQKEPSLRVTVIEPDPFSDLASSATSGSGGSRRLFFCPENIAMSNFSIEYMQSLDASAESPFAGVDWHSRGYLFIVPPKGIELLESNLEIQHSMGVEASLFTPEQIQERFPMMRVDDLGAGVFSPRDGWFNAQKYWALMVQKARDAGVEFVQDAVVGFDEGERLVTAAKLRSGRSLRADFFVNAAGPWAQQISQMIGMPLPINPMVRYEHNFTTEFFQPNMPYVKDLQGLAIRSTNSGYSGGLVDTKTPRGFAQALDVNWFDRIVRPAVNWRFPGMGELQLTKSWSGLYEQCDLDGNPIIGPWTGKRDNFIVAAGFSGHGLMHAPATGLAVAEWIVDGRYQTIDLTRFGHSRVERNEPYKERGII